METQTGRLILLAEDDIDDQEFLIEALLELDGSLQIHVEDSGEKAIEYLQQVPDATKPGLIILDYNLPKLNGFQVLSFLGNDPRYQGITKLIWSTSNSPLYQQRCLQEGAAAYLVKPADLPGIKKVAETVLSFLQTALGKATAPP